MIATKHGIYNVENLSSGGGKSWVPFSIEDMSAPPQRAVI